jgi:hypothetical protein
MPQSCTASAPAHLLSNVGSCTVLRIQRTSLLCDGVSADALAPQRLGKA